MNICRPEGGFRIIIRPNVAVLVANKVEQLPAFEQYWNDILERLRFVAHLEGVSDHRFGAGYKLWAAQADTERGLPRVRLVYLALGDKVTVSVACFD